MSRSKIETEIVHGRGILDINPSDIQRLLLHLQTHPCDLERTAANLEQMALSSQSYLAIATEAGSLVTGMTTVNYNPIPAGFFGMIDDVVKTPGALAGTGRELVKLVCRHAFIEKQVGFVMLKSNQARVAARRMYADIGFKAQDTDVFRLNAHEWSEV